MAEKCALCERTLHHVEEFITGHCFYCIKKAKGPAEMNHAKSAKTKWELENEKTELKNETADLSNQPRIIGLMKRLKCLGEAVE